MRDSLCFDEVLRMKQWAEDGCQKALVGLIGTNHEGLTKDS